MLLERWELKWLRWASLTAKAELEFWMPKLGKLLMLSPRRQLVYFMSPIPNHDLLSVMSQKLLTTQTFLY